MGLCEAAVGAPPSTSRPCDELQCVEGGAGPVVITAGFAMAADALTFSSSVQLAFGDALTAELSAATPAAAGQLDVLAVTGDATMTTVSILVSPMVHDGDARRLSTPGPDPSAVLQAFAQAAANPASSLRSIGSFGPAVVPSTVTYETFDASGSPLAAGSVLDLTANAPAPSSSPPAPDGDASKSTTPAWVTPVVAVFGVAVVGLVVTLVLAGRRLRYYKRLPTTATVTVPKDWRKASVPVLQNNPLSRRTSSIRMASQPTTVTPPTEAPRTPPGAVPAAKADQAAVDE